MKSNFLLCRHTVAVYAKLSVPIFEWGKRRNEKRAASFQIGAATDNLHQVSDHVNLEVQTARVSLSQAMEQVQLTRNSLEKARKNEQMALENSISATWGDKSE